VVSLFLLPYKYPYLPLSIVLIIIIQKSIDYTYFLLSFPKISDLIDFIKEKGYFMYIVHISCEFAPIAKVGGLGDVVSGLSHALVREGHQVDVILPKYDILDTTLLQNLKIETEDLESYYDKGWISNTLWSAQLDKVGLLFIDPDNLTKYFKRGIIYGAHDDIERFTYFSRAALELLIKTKRHPDIIHLHDWQTAITAPLLKDLYNNIGLEKTKIVFTSHNLAYQGQCEPINLDRIGLSSENYLSLDKLLDNEYASIANLTKGAITYSDFMTTVSPNYAKEVCSSEGGHRLHHALRDKGDKFAGILNGIDYHYWNPETDPLIQTQFSIKTLNKKADNKHVIREKLGLGQEDKPLVACITRLVPQKSPNLIRTALYRCLEKNAQCVILGSSSLPEINEMFYRIRDEFNEHPDIFIELEFNETLSHLIYAAADIFIVPSLFEPCGLTPLIAMRYGTVPVVRNTGGLADTIKDVDYSELPSPKRNGFLFNDPDNSGVCSALDRAIDLWFNDKDSWQQLMINGMLEDFSWKSAAQHYIKIYANLSRVIKQEI